MVILLAYLHYKIFVYLQDLSANAVATVNDVFADSAVLGKCNTEVLNLCFNDYCKYASLIAGRPILKHTGLHAELFYHA